MAQLVPLVGGELSTNTLGLLIPLIAIYPLDLELKLLFFLIKLVVCFAYLKVHYER